MAETTIYILPIKTMGFAPHTPETDENDENGGCHSSKTTVRQKDGFHHPELEKKASNDLICFATLSWSLQLT